MSEDARSKRSPSRRPGSERSPPRPTRVSGARALAPGRVAGVHTSADTPGRARHGRSPPPRDGGTRPAPGRPAGVLPPAAVIRVRGRAGVGWDARVIELPDVVRAKAVAVGAPGWLDDLPDLVADLEREWGIAVGASFPD